MQFPASAASFLFLSMFGYKIGVLKSAALFQGKELQVTGFKVMCFRFERIGVLLELALSHLVGSWLG